MNPRQFPLSSCRIGFFVLTVVLFASSGLSATTETPLYAFLGQPDGLYPSGGLVADSAGNLYGTTWYGGTDYSCRCGTVFELSPSVTTGGSWTETILYSFRGPAANDGWTPGGSVVIDGAGNLFGSTYSGPSNSLGTIFELSPPSSAGGTWTETLLWVLPADGSKGYGLWSNLTKDAAGNLYGTAELGGTHQGGVVFQLVKPKTAGQPWIPKVLYNFGATANDGTYPAEKLIFHDGTIYGTTLYGGTGRHGTVFQLVRNPNFSWIETVIHSFTTSEGNNAKGGLVMDSAGNLFGTTEYGGEHGCLSATCGMIYELSPISGGQWQLTRLYSFRGAGDGAFPQSGLWRDKLGNLFGTASAGGNDSFACSGGPGCGTVFKLKAPAKAGGAWTLHVLHDFGGSTVGGDGSLPDSALTYFNGVLYGTTSYGGNASSNGGTVFSIVP
jgi:uncharacterized repeat protein (TIGR03803 family)